MSYFKESKLKRISVYRVMCECCDNWNSWSSGDPVLHNPKWIQCDLLKPITLSLSSHTIQSVDNNPWRCWKDPQTSQVNKCPDIYSKSAQQELNSTLHKKKSQGKLITPLAPTHKQTTCCVTCVCLNTCGIPFSSSPVLLLEELCCWRMRVSGVCPVVSTDSDGCTFASSVVLLCVSVLSILAHTDSEAALTE